MTTLLNNLSYIPPNNEHNEPTQGDIGETSNEPTQATRNEFEELYTSANEELYPSYDYVTRLDFIAKFTYFKVKAPTIILFRGDDNEDLDFCPVCNTSRWKDSNTPGKKVPKKVLRYFLIIPILQRLYKSSHTAKEMIWYATGKCTKRGKMQHSVDGRAWKNFVTKYTDFAKELKNVRLGLAADGFNPFGNLSQAYNMWPMILTTYNLPPWLCMKERLKVLWDRKGIETIDVASGQKFNMKEMVLWTINDFPARSSLFGWSGQGYKACPTCNKDTPSVHVLSKTAYVGHKRFLKKPHKWRSSREFNGQIDNRDPPKEFGKDEILAQLDRLPTRLTENQKKFCQFIKGVKLPDGFGSCFKHKVTDNDTNITGLKSHDCHIMMQCLLPYGLQNYLPDKIAKPIIELCSLFKQICSTTLMEDDMLKAQIKVVDILCDLELIYPCALFDIMIHLVIHLPLEAIEGGPICPRWMFPFERYMKKLKGYVRNKVKLEGSIAEGYVVEEALTFSSHYFRDVTTKFNHSDRNMDPLPQRVSSRCSNRLNDLDNATLHIDGQSTEVDVPLDIIDVVDEDDDITDDEDALPHDLADSDNEDLINVDDDDICQQMLPCPAAVTVEVRIAPSTPLPSGCMGCFANRELPYNFSPTTTSGTTTSEPTTTTTTHHITHHHHHYSQPNPPPPPLLTTEPTTTTTTRPPAESTSGRAESAAESTAESTAVSTADRSYGFDLSYKTWVHHGEPALPLPPPVIDNTRQPQMSDMTALLNDLSYIPPNNEHNEPTQGDIGETSNEPTQATCNEFEELYASANEELYPSCDYVTRLDFMAKFTYFKVKGKLTDSIFNEMLKFFQNVFLISKGYKLPPSYYAINKTFKMIGLGYESIHACEHDCCLFWGDDNKDLDFCPVCNTSRWKDSNTPGKKVPKNVLRYFSIIPRLQRLYKSSHTAKEMIWHVTGKCTEPGKMQHPADGRAWKKFDTKYLDFVKEPRNVRLGLAADGFNPFGNLSQAYSMWPVILTTYNQPSWLCMIESSFMLTLLIPDPKSPGKDINVYLRPLIEDLKFAGWSGQGYKAYPTCNKDTPFVRVLSKTTYVGHRRFLKKPHKWRSSREFNGQTDNRDPPKEFGRDEILRQLDRLPTRLTGKHPSFGGVKIKRNVLVELNWIKRSIFYELLNTLLMNDKYKDIVKARQDLQRLGIRSGLWLGQAKNGKCLKPQATYSLTPEKRKSFVSSLKKLNYQMGLDHASSTKLQNYLPDKIAKPIIKLCSLFKQICSATLMEDDMMKAQIKVVDILCDLELIYPPALFDIMIHLVIHLLLEALEGGPIRPRWMYPFERYMKTLKGYVRNKPKPKGSTAEVYVTEEALTFSSHYFRDVTTKFNRPDRNVDPPLPTCQFQVFRS
nr:hypothetical protein [Tanacetum cinerariifolium]